ncbi:MAG: ATP-binding cassette domain-containing protein [Myxococcota bacterium]
MIRIQGVSKSFGKLRVLSDISFEVRRGERVALVGSNGSGKTTLLRALLGLVRVEGKVSVDGVDVSAHPELALKKVAYVPQVAPPLEAPVAEVVRAVASLRGIEIPRIEQCACELGLSLAELAERRFRDLSGGMKQKFLAALALAADADLLICDEPTANLDSRARERFFELLDERRPARALILCSHRADDVSRLVDRVIELDEGRVISDRYTHECDHNEEPPSQERVAC